MTAICGACGKEYEKEGKKLTCSIECMILLKREYHAEYWRQRRASKSKKQHVKVNRKADIMDDIRTEARKRYEEAMQ